MHGTNTSILAKAKLHDHTQKRVTTSLLQKWLPRVMSAGLVVAAPLGSYHIYQAAESGVISLFPYPLYAVFALVTFLLYRDSK